jgi:hypothetical protein
LGSFSPLKRALAVFPERLDRVFHAGRNIEDQVASRETPAQRKRAKAHLYAHPTHRHDGA